MLLILFLMSMYLNMFFFSYTFLLVQLVILSMYFMVNFMHMFFMGSYLMNSIILVDNSSWFLMFLLVVVMYLMYSFILEEVLLAKKMVFSVMCLVIFCSFIFITNNFMVFYIVYECSLLPMMFIIIKFGKYSNRYLSSLMLMVYTSLFAVPFLFALSNLYVKVYSFSIIFLDLSLVIGSFNFFLFSLMSFFIFLVKLPCYGLHFWLPLAHVEAPTSGSMILAGILLKLSVMGMIRFSKFITHHYMMNYTQSYFVMSMFCATLLCCFQSDFKSLVAYSSISHMSFIPLLILSNTKVFFNTSILISLFHGFSSVFMFMLVSQVYLINKTRQMYYIHGLTFIYPMLTLLSLLSFMSSLSMPPFPSFLPEVISFVCISSFSVFNMLILFLFSFISGIYSLQWLTMLFFSKSKNYISYSHINYSNLISLFYMIIIFVPFILLMNFIMN